MPDSETACPTCGADGVSACVGAFPPGADHEGRPPYFDEKTAFVLDMMRRDIPSGQTAP